MGALPEPNRLICWLYPRCSSYKNGLLSRSCHTAAHSIEWPALAVTPCFSPLSMRLLAFPFSVLSGAIGPPVLKVLAGGGQAAPAVSDEELVARALAGDRLSCDVLVARHLPKLLARTRRLLGYGADAEDVVQDAFVEALRDLSKLREPRLFGGWVAKIAVHQVHRRFRRHRLRRTLGLVSDEMDSVLERQVQSGADPSVRAQLCELDAVLSGQKPRDRLAWMLRHVEGLSLPEVAEQVGCSLATVKRSLVVVQAAVAERFGAPIFEEEAP